MIAGGGDDQPVAPALGVVAEPLAPVLHRGRLDVERDVGLGDVMVIDLVDRLEIGRGRGSDVDGGVDHGGSVYFRQLDACIGSTFPACPSRPPTASARPSAPRSPS